MKKPTGVLVLSLCLLLPLGCRSSRSSEDASTPPQREPIGQDQGGLTGAPPSGTNPDSGKAQQTSGDRQALESCVDAWLKTRNLDSYGHPEGTMYAGGTPLFNEATGESRDRLEYVFERQPEAKAACVKDGSQPR